MIPVSGIPAGQVQQLPAAAEARNAPSKEEPRPTPQRPVTDEYIPEEKQEPSGLYWLERDEDGNPQIRFDDPGQPEESPEAGKPEKESRKAETITGNTDQVDREIEKLKKERDLLEQQLAREDDETRRGELEQKLARIENELRQKDNDAYRRQHTVFS